MTVTNSEPNPSPNLSRSPRPNLCPDVATIHAINRCLVKLAKVAPALGLGLGLGLALALGLGLGLG